MVGAGAAPLVVCHLMSFVSSLFVVCQLVRNYPANDKQQAPNDKREPGSRIPRIRGSVL
jgi:hypothetical protein